MGNGGGGNFFAQRSDPKTLFFCFWRITGNDSSIIRKSVWFMHLWSKKWRKFNKQPSTRKKSCGRILLLMCLVVFLWTGWPTWLWIYDWKQILLYLSILTLVGFSSERWESPRGCTCEKKHFFSVCVVCWGVGCHRVMLYVPGHEENKGGGYVKKHWDQH